MICNDKLKKKKEMTAIRDKNTDNFYLSGSCHYKEADQRSCQNSAYKKVSMCWPSWVLLKYLHE